MRKYYLAFSKYVALLLGFMVVGFGLLVLAYSLPTGRIERHVKASVGQLNQETQYFSAFGKGLAGSKQDNYTEAIYLSQAFVGKEDGGAVHAALEANSYLDKTPLNGLNSQLKHDGKAKPSSGKRFWNGWEVPLKVMLQFVSYRHVRAFNFITQSVLLFLVGILLVKRNLSAYAFPFFMACLFMNPVTMALSMTFTGFYFEILISALVMLRFNEKIRKKGWYGYFFALLGMTAFYFNMNYYQLCTVGIPLVLYFILNEAESGKEIIFTSFKYGALWFFGFAGMMLLKWTVYAVLVNPNVWQQTIGRAIQASGTAMPGNVNASRMSVVMRNLKEGFGNPSFVIMECLFLLYEGIQIVREGMNRMLNWKAEIILPLLCLIVVIGRYMVEANHSYVHYWVMYRNLAIVIFAVNVFLVKLRSDTEYVMGQEAEAKK